MSEFDFSAYESILVTGGAGFIGSHLVERLLEHDCDVVALDNYYTGSRRNLAHLMDNPRLDIVRHDVRNPFWGEFDLIMNLACPPPRSSTRRTRSARPRSAFSAR